MERRNFIKNTGLAAAGILATPHILPSGSLYANTASRKVNHVVLCLLGGGVRNNETVFKAEGNLMPNTFFGKEAIASDLAKDITSLDAQLDKPLQAFGTLLKSFSYKDGALSHFNAQSAVLTGQYFRDELNHKQKLYSPTIFEYYRKSQSPFQSRLKTWLVSNPIAPYPSLISSMHADFGKKYAGNWLSPSLANSNNSANSLYGQQTSGMYQSAWSIELNSESYSLPKIGERQKLDFFHSKINTPKHLAQTNADWSLFMGFESQDLLTINQAEKILETFNPELLVVNMQEMDIAHSNFTKYCDKITKADYALAHLWNSIQQNAKMAENTLMIVLPDHGRNAKGNELFDHNGRLGLDHFESEACRDIFCLVLGPKHLVKQNHVINQSIGESIDVLPTIADVLGFSNELKQSKLKGRVLEELFV